MRMGLDIGAVSVLEVGIEDGFKAIPFEVLRLSEAGRAGVGEASVAVESRCCLRCAATESP